MVSEICYHKETFDRTSESKIVERCEIRALLNHNSPSRELMTVIILPVPYVCFVAAILFSFPFFLGMQLSVKLLCQRGTNHHSSEETESTSPDQSHR